MYLNTLESVQKRIIKAVGKTGAVELAVLGAYRPGKMHASQIHTVIKCRGDTYDGYVPYQQLLKEGLFNTVEGFNNIQHNGSPSLDHIALAFPYLPMMWVLEHKAQNCCQFVNKVPGTDTSLPLELQYLQAAALPLYPRSRIAHVNFTIQILRSRGIYFQPKIYRRLMSLAYIHAQVPDTLPMLGQLEQQIGELTQEEKKVQAWWPWKT
ncbi:hypothetical protein [Parasitella parasitica]|uniref:Uncharacterized protein n=1 Tax=Parasitella parasitica TaxID=35722 RepID=A0A0B7NXJ8_9FUNG|nr:hypothetical protein [Parasitella parasitica]